jgi:hypothetical protein
MRYQFAVLPRPPFQVAQKSGQKSSDDGNVHELYLPMQHVGPLPCGRLGTTEVSVGSGDGYIPLWGDSLGALETSLGGQVGLGETGFAKRPSSPGEAIDVPACEGDDGHALSGGVDHPAVAEVDPRVVDL